MKLPFGLHCNKCSHHFKCPQPKQLGCSAVAVLVFAIPIPDLAGINQKVKEVVPWLQASAASLTIAKALKPPKG